MDPYATVIDSSSSDDERSSSAPVPPPAPASLSVSAASVAVTLAYVEELSDEEDAAALDLLEDEGETGATVTRVTASDDESDADVAAFAAYNDVIDSNDSDDDTEHGDKTSTDGDDVALEYEPDAYFPPTEAPASPLSAADVRGLAQNGASSSGGGVRAAASSDFDWNGVFQALLQLPDSYEKYSRLSALYRDFCYAAKTYGRIIISEKAMPPEKRTIPPIDAGGRAGGVKYKAQGILFKFAVDTFEEHARLWLYGLRERADHLAAKAAGHELKGLIAMFNARHVAPRLHFPLLALIDYRGYRLIAIAWLPIHKDTLRYGSHDAGRTVHADVPELNEQMRKVGTYLNLAGHHVGTQPELLYLCGDIEGHVGTDARFYCLDFARVFPPEKLPAAEKALEVDADSGATNSFLYKLLRPELVLSHPTPLNSDARSQFIARDLYREEFKAANAGVQAATERLLKEVVPAFAATLAKLSPLELQRASYSLTDELHRVGINCRHLGRVRRALPPSANNFKQTFVLTEIVARACKNRLRALWRHKLEQMRVPSSEPYLDVAVDFFNALLHNGGDLWRAPAQLKAQIQTSFPGALTDAELSATYDLRRSVDLAAVLLRLQRLAKVKLTKRVNALLRGASASELAAVQLLKVDVKSVSCGVKQLPLVALSEGKLLLLQAQHGITSRAQTERLFRLANERFAHALAGNVNNSEILYAWGQALVLEAQRADFKAARALLKEAHAKFTRCCELAHTDALFSRAIVLAQLAAHALEKPAEYDALEEARASLRQLATALSAAQLEQRLAHEAHTRFDALAPLVLAAPVPSAVLAAMMVDDEWTAQRRSEEAVDTQLAQLAAAYHWHALVLEHCFSAVLLLRCADIARRWAAHLLLARRPGSAALFAKACQLLEVALQRSALTFPLVPRDTAVSAGPTALFLKKLPTALTRPAHAAPSDKERAEGAARPKRLQELGRDESTSGLQGYLHVLAKKRHGLGKTWKRRWATLRAATLILTDSRDSTPSSAPAAHASASASVPGSERYELKHATVELVPRTARGRAHCFKLTCANSDVLLVALRTAEERAAWMSAVARAALTTPLPGALATMSTLHVHQVAATSVRDELRTGPRVRDAGSGAEREAEYKVATLDEAAQVQPPRRVTVAATRLLVPTLHVCYQRDAHAARIEQLFAPLDDRAPYALSAELALLLTFDFGDVCLSQWDVRLSADTLAHVDEARLSDAAVKAVVAVFASVPSAAAVKAFLDANAASAYAALLHEHGARDVLTCHWLHRKYQSFTLPDVVGRALLVKLTPRVTTDVVHVAFFGAVRGLHHVPHLAVDAAGSRSVPPPTPTPLGAHRRDTSVSSDDATVSTERGRDKDAKKSKRRDKAQEKKEKAKERSKEKERVGLSDSISLGLSASNLSLRTSHGFLGKGKEKDKEKEKSKDKDKLKAREKPALLAQSSDAVRSVAPAVLSASAPALSGARVSALVHRHASARTQLALHHAIVEEKVAIATFERVLASHEELALALRLVEHSHVFLRALEELYHTKRRAQREHSALAPSAAPHQWHWTRVLRDAATTPVPGLVALARTLRLTASSASAQSGFTRSELQELQRAAGGEARVDVDALIAHGLLRAFPPAAHDADPRYEFTPEVDAPFHSVSDFVQQLPYPRLVHERLARAQGRVVEADLSCVTLAHSVLVNGFVLDTLGRWGSRHGALHSVDVAHTVLRDSELLALLRHAGPTLRALTLKGCSRLSAASAHHIAHHCAHALQHLAPCEHWDDDALAALLASLTALRYLDLSECAHVGVRTWEALRSVRYLDLTRAPLERRALKSWFSRYGKGLEALLLTRAPNDAQHHVVDDDLLAAFAHAAPALLLLDVSYCRALTTKSLRALHACTRLQSLRLAGVSDHLTGPALAELAHALPQLHHLELRRRGNADLADLDALLTALAATPQRAMSALTVRALKVSDSAVAGLVRAHAGSLTRIDLSECETALSDLAAKELAACTRLTELQLHGCTRVSDDAIRSILVACPDLVVVGLSGCAVSDATLHALLRPVDAATRLRRRALHTLLLAGCQSLSSDATEAIAAAQALHVLKLSRCEFLTAESALRIASRCTELRVLDISKCPNLPMPPTSLPGKPAASQPPPSATDLPASEVSAFEVFKRQLIELLPSTVIHI